MTPPRIAVILLNLGGPDSLDAVRPFLFNLFNDPAIIGAPGPLRWLLATLIARRRAPVAREIYREIGGRSPLLELTREQADALGPACAGIGEVGVFIAMRHWHPMAAETVADVSAWKPDEIVLLPLYPQHSTTTTASSFAAWHDAAGAAGLRAPTRAVCCYPLDSEFVEAHARKLADALQGFANAPAPRVLFSAHGLPQKVIARGDPYQWQIERTCAAVAARAEAMLGRSIDAVTCYQSRVGPLRWIGPSTPDELRRSGAAGEPVVVLPIAFVSEHSETLVELDIEYRRLAGQAGVPRYERVPALGTAPAFIAGLAGLVAAIRAQPAGAVCPADGVRLCPTGFGGCGCQAQAL